MVAEATPTTRALSELAGWTGSPCVSAYLPVDPLNPGTSADRIRLKDVVRDARRQLESLPLPKATVDELFAPFGEIRPAEMWRGGGRSRALFRAPGKWTTLELTTAAPMLAVVSDRFVVTPLLAAIPPPGRYYLLALSQQNVRLLAGDHSGLRQVEVEELPASIAEALWYEEVEYQLNVHGGGTRGGGGLLRTTHGSTSHRDVHDDRLLRFFRAVDDSISAAVADHQAPLIVAGVDYELAIYRHASRYPRLASLLPIGSPDHLGPAELHARSWPFALQALDEQRKERLQLLERSGEPAVSLPSVLSACRQGKVDTLFVRPDRLAWGTTDDDGVNSRADRQPGDTELYSAAIGAAIAQGATVHPLWPGEFADNIAIAALLRY